MEQLSALDALFLQVETAETPMHLATLHELELPKGYKGDFVADVQAHVAKRLHLAPILHRRLLRMPYDLLTPMWIDDDDIDLDHHIRHIVLRKPGSHEQLRALVGRLQSAQLDRSRPLWELILIEGLAGGRWALMVKVHHAGVDGQSGRALNEALMDITQQAREVRPPRGLKSLLHVSGRATARAAQGARRVGRQRAVHVHPPAAELARIGIRNLASKNLELLRRAPQLLRSLSQLSGALSASSPRMPAWMNRLGIGDKAAPGVPRTRFNVSVTNQRVWADTTLPLAEVKRIAKASGCSVNDVLFAVSGAALRKYLTRGHELPGRSLVALMPVSTREAGDMDMSNKVSMASVSLHTDEDDPLRQMRAIHADTRAIKEGMSRIQGGGATDPYVPGMPWLMSGLFSLVGRLNLAEALPLAGNLVISSFVAATTPMYFCGARVLTFSPVLVLMHGQAMSLAMQTYHDRIDIGVTGCRRAMPDVAEIADNISAAFAQLRRAVDRQAAAQSGIKATTGSRQAAIGGVPAAARRPDAMGLRLVRAAPAAHARRTSASAKVR